MHHHAPSRTITHRKTTSTQAKMQCRSLFWFGAALHLEMAASFYFYL